MFLTEFCAHGEDSGCGAGNGDGKACGEGQRRTSKTAQWQFPEDAHLGNILFSSPSTRQLPRKISGGSSDELLRSG